MKHLKSHNEHNTDTDSVSQISDPVLNFYNELIRALPHIFQNVITFENSHIKSVDFRTAPDFTISKQHQDADLVKYNAEFVIYQEDTKDWMISHQNRDHIIVNFNELMDFLKLKTELDRFLYAEVEIWQKAIELDLSLFTICPNRILKKIKPKLSKVTDIGVFDKD